MQLKKKKRNRNRNSCSKKLEMKTLFGKNIEISRCSLIQNLLRHTERNNANVMWETNSTFLAQLFLRSLIIQTAKKKKIHKLDGFVVTYSFLSFARQTQVYTHAEKGPLHCCDDLNRSFFLRFFPLIFCLACFKCLYLGNSLYFLLYEISF